MLIRLCLINACCCDGPHLILLSLGPILSKMPVCVGFLAELRVHGKETHWTVKLVKLVSWCFKLSQPQKIISRLKETFIKKYIVERTNRPEIRLEEPSEKTESCRVLLVYLVLSPVNH